MEWEGRRRNLSRFSRFHVSSGSFLDRIHGLLAGPVQPFSSRVRGVVNTAWDRRKTVPKKHICSLLTKCWSSGPRGREKVGGVKRKVDNLADFVHLLSVKGINC